MQKCKIDKCNRKATYKKQQVCQKHYFRKMRYGTYELTATAPKYRVGHSGGYLQVLEPDHVLASERGYVYEHRFVYYEQVSKTISECALCRKAIDWDSVHIDHIDENRKNNSPKNLRALCNACNVWRNRDHTKIGQQFTYLGKTQNAGAWAKEDFIKVNRNTITRRRRKGMTDKECLTAEKITHKEK